MLINEISYGRQFIDRLDLREVSKALNSKYLSSGKYVYKFESFLKKKLKSKHALVCNSGTSAIHLALLSINLKENDVVILPAINFIAAANMAFLMGAKLFFADIDYKTGQINSKTIIDCIKKNKIKKVKVIINMYLGGYPRNIVDLYKLKKKLKCYLIEDACHAFGSKYRVAKKNYNVGSCKHSDLCTFSFHPLKSITTGEGGLVTTNNSFFYKKIQLLRSHGIFKNHKNYWQYSINSPGYNFRLSDINCALGLAQLKKLDKFLKKRKLIFNFYKKNLSDYKGIVNLIIPEEDTLSSYHLIIILINFEKLKINKSFFFKKMIKKNIYCQYHYIPNFLFNKFLIKNNKFYINSLRYYKNAISIPVYYSLNNNDLKKVVCSIKNIIDDYIR
jgi:dTDP-4-amino-4,6-dideoxygalactose transaminase